MKETFSETATYLWVAEAVLRKHGRPLRARQIVSIGLEDGLFSDKEISKTPEKSMQARLSMEILSGGAGSRFLRTEKGKFFLRDLYVQGVQSDEMDMLREYTATRRRPLPPTENVLVVPKSSYVTTLNYQGIDADYEGILNSLLKTNSMYHLPRTEAETNSEVKQFVTYTIIQHRNRILSFRRGQYNRAASFLRGARCIGFGGHVTEDDLNIFTYGDRGIKANAAREISEELRLKSGPPVINPDDFEVLGFLNDDSSSVGVRHVAAVLRYWAPDSAEWLSPMRGEASVSQLKWIDTSGAEIDLLDFEYWSQLCLRNFYPQFVASKPTFRVIKEKVFREPHTLCIIGSIGSGKSVTTQRFCEQAGYVQVNTGRVIAELLGLPPVPTTPRGEFQEKAMEFIRTPDGPKKLAASIDEEVRRVGHDRVIIDGVRQLETLEMLRAISLRKIACIFVYTPPDSAYEFYTSREAAGELSLSKFMRMYNAPVESEVPSMIQEADAIVYNWLGIEKYEKVVRSLIERLGLAK